MRRKKMAIFQVTKQTGASLLKKRTRWPAKRGIRRRNKIEEALLFFSGTSFLKKRIRRRAKRGIRERRKMVKAGIKKRRKKKTWVGRVSNPRA